MYFSSVKRDNSQENIGERKKKIMYLCCLCGNIINLFYEFEIEILYYNN